MTATLKPYDHQKVGVRFLLGSRNRVIRGERQRGCILADELGLGKTITALLAAKAHKLENAACRVLVIAPKSLLGNWKREAAVVGVKIDAFLSDHHASFPEGQEGTFVVIVDEAHRFQNPKSNRTERFLALVNGKKLVDREEVRPDGSKKTWEEEVRTGDEAASVYLLTGTPIKNGRPHNLLPLLLAINHGLVAGGGRKKVGDYLFRYCGPEKNRFGWTFNGATNLDELHELTRPSILRRLKTECLDLPELTRTTREVELTDAEASEYNALLATLRAEYVRRLREGKIKTGGEKLVFFTQLRRAGSMAKAGTAVEMAEEVLEENGQVIVFTCFRDSAAKIAAHFGVKVFDGSLSVSERDQIVADFQSGKQKVFVGIDKAGGVGLTLHAHGRCTNVLLVDRPWTPGDALQLEGRAHRIGQPNAVTATWLQHGQIDQTVDAILQEKWANAEHVLNGTPGALPFGDTDMADAVADALGWQ